MGEVRPFIARRLGRLDRDDMLILRTRPLPEIIDDEALKPRVRLAARRALRELQREQLISKRREFEVIFSGEFGRLVRHLRLTSKQPMVAVELFALCMREMDWVTGEVLLTRDAIAKELGIEPRSVSRLMGELVKCSAMRRDFKDDEGNRTRAVRYFVNPCISYRGESSAAIDQERAKFPPLKLVGGTDLPTERRSRAPRFEPAVL